MKASRLHFTTYFRQYDPRLGRWWSNDPVVQAGESPYAAMSNNPIVFTDPFGNCLDCPKDAKQGDVHKGWIYTDGKWVPKPSSGTTSSESVYEQAMAARNTAKPISEQSRKALASPVPKPTEAERFALEQTDNNDVKVVRHYANPGRTGMHVTQFGNGDEIVEHGTAPTVSAVDPVLSGQGVTNNAQLGRYLHNKLFQLQASPKTSPVVKLLAGAADEVVNPGPLTIAAYAVPILRIARMESLVASQAPLLRGAELLAGESSSSLRFTQITASPAFSAEGTFAGETIGSLASKLRSNNISVADVPVEFIDVPDLSVRLIVNTRSSLALYRAGIPSTQWNLINMTNDLEVQLRITERLLKNKLSTEGTSLIRITGKGKFISNLE